MTGKQSNEIPKNWPTQIPYLKAPSYSPRLTPGHFTILSTQATNAILIPPNTPKGPTPLVKITQVTDSNHPAFGQAGLFATRDLKPGAFILEYIGVVHKSSPAVSANATGAVVTTTTTQTGEDEHAESDYDLTLDREVGLAIDAARMGNEARFVNDYRGIADRPNAEFREVWCPMRRERGMAVWVLPMGKNESGKGKGIRKGEEIVVTYGKGFWGARRVESDTLSNE